ncbi:glycoside hydrolase family 24 protein [Epilithonimonas caeni]|uniref:glycoside hydrolase family 24 protein n=1 Tax=Epilithonimonas caeni TaxID=365343 RepID=UPI00041461AB|nr:glycoside hydrolase family 104 protein [Epilithonimonas caeni]
MKIIKGSTSPKAEEKTFYELTGLVPDFSNPIFNNKPKEKYIWTLFKKDKATGWKQVSNNIKYGEKAPYTFGEKVVGILYRIEVHTETKNLLNVTEKKFVANLVVTPRTAKEPVIGRVILLNRGNSDVNKAKFNESLSAEARTSNLFGKEIAFYLWEEGASEADKYKKPKKAFVDKNGIAKVKFNLSEYATPQTIMDFFTGDSKSSKKFYVSAQYNGKTIDNKTPVVASKGQETPKPQTNKPAGGIYGFIENTTEVIAEGIEKIGDAITEQTKSPAIVKGNKQQEKKNDENKICECEARVRAYMRMLRVGEGTGEIIKSSKYNKETKKNEIVYINHDFEGGYTKLFGGGNFTKSPYNKDMNNHPQIKVLWYTKKNGEKVYSSAAGAYQVMGYTWNDKDMINKRKTYNVKGFSPEGQDKFCVVLFKHKRAGMLDLIIKGDIKGATEKYGSYEWASLPPGQYGQPIETMEKALELYNQFYKEELAGKSPLHLKKGFLKEFGENCCGESTPKPSTGESSCGKSEIDLRDKIKWQTQFDPKWGARDRQLVACKKTCDDILINSGLKATSLLNLYQTAIENDDHTKLIINNQVSKEAIAYLDSELEKGHPVQVGVDHGLGYKINNNADHSTDHFVVIIGRKCDGNKCYYLFYDVGTSHKEKGASDNNRLYFDKTDFSLKGTTVYNGHLYTVTQVRKN